MFSRWKERYFILTRDYLHCFKRASGSGPGKISEMGQFIFKVNRSFISVLIGYKMWFNVILNVCGLLKHERKISLEKTWAWTGR